MKRRGKGVTCPCDVPPAVGATRGGVAHGKHALPSWLLQLLTSGMMKSLGKLLTKDGCWVEDRAPAAGTMSISHRLLLLLLGYKQDVHL